MFQEAFAEMSTEDKFFCMPVDTKFNLSKQDHEFTMKVDRKNFTDCRVKLTDRPLLNDSQLTVARAKMR